MSSKSLKRFENWRFKPWGAHVEIKRALNIVVAPKCVLMWGRNCRDACRDRNKREYRKVSPSQWWQPGSQDSEHDSQDSIRMRWKKNRKSRLGLGLEAEAGRRVTRPRFDELGEPIKSAGEASGSFACHWVALFDWSRL